MSTSRIVSLAPSSKSVAEQLALLPAEQRDAVLGQFSEEERAGLAYAWSFWGREKQFAPPGDWSTWLLLQGRGSGKTRTGAEWVRSEVENGRRGRLALIARTAADARDTMVEGESGILATSRPEFRPDYEPSKRRLTWPNGAIATTFSAEEPEALRGPQHDGGWCDEVAAWKYPEETWDNYQFGLRLGRQPQTVCTTTPRPIPLVRALIKDPTTRTTRGTTYENAANLPGKFLKRLLDKYEGTRLGRQELHAEILDDNPGALWKRDQLDKLRVKVPPQLIRLGIGVDPAVTAHEGSDETGIVAAGVGSCWCLGRAELHGFVLEDKSGIYTPAQWAYETVKLYKNYEADHVIAEVNKGGDLVAANIRTADEHVPVKSIRATRGKATRAEPIAALYEQGKVHHVGFLPQLEDQLCDWCPSDSDSPDRLDAVVWVLADLMLSEEVATFGSSDKRIRLQRRM